MRILIFSNAPHAGTGYGQQTALLAPRLRDAGHEVAILAYFGLEGTRMDWDGIPVFPKSRHPASQDWMVPLALQVGADAVLAVTDPWIIETERFAGTDVAYVPWFPVDGSPMDRENARGITGPGPMVRVPVATSRHAAAMARNRGITDVRVVPYMVDTNIYKPGDRAAARVDWGIPADAFVVGMVAMNKTASGIDRKRFFEQIGGFARLREKHSDALLYLHTHVTAPDGVALQEIINHWGIPRDAVMFTAGPVMTIGAPAQLMAQLYQSFDVLLGVTGGEGGGVPLLEASACGTPCIWGDWTAMPEYAKAGWAVGLDESQESMNAGRVIWRVPFIPAIAAKLEDAYQADRAALVDDARAGALDHDADSVVRDGWLPVLTEVEARRADAARVRDVEIPDVLLPTAVAA